MKVSGCEDFVSKWEEFIFDPFSYFKPVKRVYDTSDIRGFRSFNNSM